MSYLQNISRAPGGGKIGGLLTLQVARKDDVASIPEAVNGTVNGPVVLKAGKSFVTWVVGYQSASITSAARSSREGTSKSNSLPFVLPMDRPGIRAVLEQAEADEFIVVFKDSRGRLKIFGTLDAPCRFEFEHSSGTTAADRNQNNCSFYYTGPPNIFFYAATVSSSPGPAPAVVSFNGVPIASLTPGQTLNILSDYDYTEYFVTE